MTNGVLEKFQLSVCPIESIIHPSPVRKWAIGIDILNIWHNSHIGSLSCSARDSIIIKAKWKSLELALLNKVVNKVQYHFPGGVPEIIATLNKLRDAVVVFPTMSSFISSVWPVQKMKVSRWLWVHYYKLNQVVTPIEATVLDVVSLFEMNTSPGT